MYKINSVKYVTRYVSVTHYVLIKLDIVMRISKIRTE